VTVVVAALLKDANEDATFDEEADELDEAKTLKAFHEWIEKNNPLDDAEESPAEGIAMSSERRKPFRMSLDQAKAAIADGGYDWSAWPPEVVKRETRSAYERNDYAALYSAFKVDPDRIVDEVFRRRR
jgi:hypothetical protein